MVSLYMGYFGKQQIIEAHESKSLNDINTNSFNEWLDDIWIIHFWNCFAAARLFIMNPPSRTMKTMCSWTEVMETGAKNPAFRYGTTNLSHIEIVVLTFQGISSGEWERIQLFNYLIGRIVILMYLLYNNNYIYIYILLLF